MKKTVTINISGIIFTIDEDAYQKLSTYLKTIKGYFKNSEGQNDIMADIEARIAEMFEEKRNKNQVISIAHVEEIMNIMGKPEDYIDEETAAEQQQNSYNSNTASDTGKNYTSKRLYRDKEGGSLGGVCSGIGYYFGFDPLWLRLLFVGSVLFLGSGFLFYFILWLVIPEAKTTAEKLEMKGQKVDINNIGKVVEEEMENVKKKFHDLKNEAKGFNPRKYSKNLGGALEKIFDFIFNLIGLVLKAFGKIIGVFVIIIGCILLFTILSITIFGSFSPDFGINLNGLEIVSIDNFTDFFLGSDSSPFFNILSLALIIGMPILAVIYAGIRLLIGARSRVKGLLLITLILWIGGIILGSFSFSPIANSFKHEESIENIISITEYQGDTLSLWMNKNYKNTKISKRLIKRRNNFLIQRGNHIYAGMPQIDIVEANGSDFEIVIEQISRGNTYNDASQRAKSIKYNVVIDANNVTFDPYFEILNKELWRAQEIQITVKVPTGKSIYLSEDMKKLIYNIDNVSNTYDGDMVNKTWTMTSRGLECIGCELD